jgi:hypothetical protein
MAFARARPTSERFQQRLLGLDQHAVGLGRGAGGAEQRERFRNGNEYYGFKLDVGSGTGGLY